MIAPPKSIKSFYAFLALLMILFFGWQLGAFFHFDNESFQNFLNGFPKVVSIPFFIAVYVVLTFVVWVGPKDVLRFLAAVLYGAYGSTLVVWLAEMLNLVILFHLSRRLGRGFLEDHLRGRWEKIDAATARTGAGWIFLFRAFPVVPLRFLDLGFGLTQVPFTRYALVSLVATPVRIFFPQYVMAKAPEALRSPEKLMSLLTAEPGVVQLSFVYVVGAVMVLLVLRRRRAF